jgi:hypothetical protein
MMSPEAQSPNVLTSAPPDHVHIPEERTSSHRQERAQCGMTVKRLAALSTGRRRPLHLPDGLPS